MFPVASYRAYAQVHVPLRQTAQRMNAPGVTKDRQIHHDWLPSTCTPPTSATLSWVPHTGTGAPFLGSRRPNYAADLLRQATTTASNAAGVPVVAAQTLRKAMTTIGTTGVAVWFTGGFSKIANLGRKGIDFFLGK